MQTLIRSLTLCTLLAFITTNSSAQAVPSATASDTKTLEQFVTPTTVIVAQFDLQKLKLGDELQKSLAANQTAQPLLAWLESMRASLQPISNDRIYMTVDFPIGPTQPPIRFFAKRPVPFDPVKLNANLARFRFSPMVEKGEFIVTSPTGNIAEADKHAITDETLSASRPSMPAAIATIVGMPIQILVLPPDYLWATYRDLMPRLPEQFGGTPTTVITEGLQWAAIGLDPATLKLQITIQSTSNSAAHALAAELPKLLRGASAQTPSQTAKSAIESVLKFGKPTVNKDRIEIEFANLQELNIAQTAVAQLLSTIVDPLNVREKMNRLKQLALAIHNYESAFKTLPPNKAARNAEGTSNFSWRVHILPFLGEGKLHAEFKLDQPWDSEHNIKLLAKMPEVFSGFPVQAFAPVNLRSGYTTFVAPVGGNTIFGGKKPVTFSDITDGLSNTIFFVEVKPDRAVPWTAPFDYFFKPANPAEDLAIGADGQFLTALGDASVRLLPGNLPKETLKHLYQMNDGNAIDF